MVQEASPPANQTNPFSSIKMNSKDQSNQDIKEEIRFQGKTEEEVARRPQ